MSASNTKASSCAFDSPPIESWMNCPSISGNGVTDRLMRFVMPARIARPWPSLGYGFSAPLIGLQVGTFSSSARRSQKGPRRTQLRSSCSLRLMVPRFYRSTTPERRFRLFPASMTILPMEASITLDSGKDSFRFPRVCDEADIESVMRLGICSAM